MKLLLLHISIALAFLTGYAGFVLPELPDFFIRLFPAHSANSSTAQTVSHDPAAAKKNIEVYRKKLKKLKPDGNYMIINTYENRFTLHKDDSVIREGLCSTGSYTRLEAGNNKEWLFTTPKGIRTIQTKKTKPVWNKPDWAFIEEGLPVPPANSEERFERGVLGDYALTMGHGYMIHGTLYQRLLGTPVTHGCVRLGDADLEAVYHNLQVGSRVYIY